MKIHAILELKGTEVFTIAPDAAVADAARRLVEENVGALVVTEDRAGVVGIVSERDIVRAYAERGPALADSRVSDLMTPKPLTCSLADGGEDLMDLMTERHVRHVPVVEGGALRGMISLGDVVKHRLKECLVESDALKRYITAA